MVKRFRARDFFLVAFMGFLSMQAAFAATTAKVVTIPSLPPYTISRK